MTDVSDTDVIDDTAASSEARAKADEASAEVLELETQLEEARARLAEAQTELMAEAAAAAMPAVEAQERDRDFRLELLPPHSMVLAERTLIPGDKVDASELQDVMGDHALMRYLSMGWFKVLDKDFPRTIYATEELRYDETVWIATGRAFERPTVVGRTAEDDAAQWKAEQDILDQIKADNEDQGVRDNRQRVLDQQTAEVARFSDAQAAMRVDEEGRAPDPGVVLLADGEPMVEDGHLAETGIKFPVQDGDDDEFIDADDEPAPDGSDLVAPAPQLETPEEQRFDSEAVDGMTVAEVKDYVDTFPAERRDEILMKVLDVESAGKNRTTLISWIEEEIGE